MLDIASIPASLRETRDALASRIESAALSFAQPREQSFYDGWLLRYSPGKARRARSVNTIGPGVLPLSKKLEHCAEFYRQRSVPLIFRVTPFSQPHGLDAALATDGFMAVGDTRVMQLAVSEAATLAASEAQARCLDVEQFAHCFAALHGLDAAKTAAERERYAQSAIGGAYVGVFDGADPIACGTVAIDGALAGIFGMVTAESHRGRGVATAIVAELLRRARAGGARIAYLQVDVTNTPARRAYSKFGFEDCYAYWYRARSETEGNP